jgi:hypothetical protein
VQRRGINIKPFSVAILLPKKQSEVTEEKPWLGRPTSGCEFDVCASIMILSSMKKYRMKIVKGGWRK